MGIPDVLLDHQIVPVQQQQHMHSDLQALELDLEHYEVPPPTSSSNSGIQYAANMAENPRELQHAASEPAPFYGESRRYQLLQGSDTGVSKDRSVSIKDLMVSPGSSNMELAAPGLVGEQPKSFPVGSLSPGCVDKGVGHSPKLIRPSSDVTLIETQLQLNSNAETMPEAAGAVAAGAVADHLLGKDTLQSFW
jgi:6-phosphofructo-2-kinase/fructose-2,6-biphosphatase